MTMNLWILSEILNTSSSYNLNNDQNYCITDMILTRSLKSRMLSPEFNRLSDQAHIFYLTVTSPDILSGDVKRLLYFNRFNRSSYQEHIYMLLL